MKVDLIPTLQVSVGAIKLEQIIQRPTSNFLQNPVGWDIYEKNVLRAAGFDDYKRVITGSSFLAIDAWSLEDLRKLIHAHLQPEDEVISVTESCALFGGGVLFLNNEPVLVPQCCSTIADIYSWKSILDPHFQSGYFCLEGHPCPKAVKENNALRIFCKDEDEAFDQPALGETSVEIIALATAFSAAEKAIDKLSKKVDVLSLEFGVQKLSDYLIKGL